MLKAGLISCWGEKQKTKSYLPGNKHSGSNLKVLCYLQSEKI